MIELNGAHTHVRAIWFMGTGGFDMLCAVIRQDGEPWKLFYRFRYYEDEQAFDSEDRKSWYSLTGEDDSDETEEKLFQAMCEVVSEGARRFTLTVNDRLDIKGDGFAALEALSKAPWSHIKPEGPVS